MRTQWASDDKFTLDGVSYHAMLGRAEHGEMHLMKPRALVEQYERMVDDLRPKRIMDLGIYRGGSAALMAQLARPEKLVAVDIDPRPCGPLEQFIDEKALRSKVVTYYGVDQSDMVRLDRIVREEFDGPVDLVIDDASHLEAPTRASFNTLFPYVRPGGLYIIEDWGWPHRPALGYDDPEPYQCVAPVSALVCEIVLAAARRRRVIPEVTVAANWATIRRGEADLNPGVFDLSRLGDPLALEMVARMLELRTPFVEPADQR